MGTGGKGVDLVVSFDTTGSMYPVLAQVRNQVESFIREMFHSVGDLRVGLIAHGDYCDAGNPYTIRAMDLTKDEDELCKFIRETKSTYGGDADECYELVLRTARYDMNWNAKRRDCIFIMIGDANPHGVNYPDNTGKIDWHTEADKLGKMGIKIYPVHALAEYRRSSKRFYAELADITGGTYLTLDNFSDITQIIMAATMFNSNEDKLNDYVTVIRDRGMFTRTFARNMERITKKSYYSEVKHGDSDGLVAVRAGRFQIMEVTENCAIKGFVEQNGIQFKKGRGFYELTKHETVQQYKEIIIQDRASGDYFAGTQVRARLGLQPQTEKGGVRESLSSRDTADFRVFVQSTSVNRKLISGTMFLYEVDELEDIGSVPVVGIKSKVPAAKAVKPTDVEEAIGTAEVDSIKLSDELADAYADELAAVEEAPKKKRSTKYKKATTSSADGEAKRADEAKQAEIMRFITDNKEALQDSIELLNKLQDIIK